MAEQRSLKALVAEEVRAQLARQKLSASRAAKAMGWSQPYISRRLTGETAFDLDDLEALAGLLGVTVGSLFGLQEDPARILTTVPNRDSPGQRSFGRDITNASWFDLPPNRCAPPELTHPGQNPFRAA